MWEKNVFLNQILHKPVFKNNQSANPSSGLKVGGKTLVSSKFNAASEARLLGGRGEGAEPPGRLTVPTLHIPHTSPLVHWGTEREGQTLWHGSALT